MVGDMDRTPATQLAFVFMIEVFEPVQVMQIPLDRRLLSVDLECVKRLVPSGVASGFKQAERSVRKPAEKRARVIDSDRLDLTRKRMSSLLNKCFGHCGDVSDAAIQPDRGVDAMREQVTGNAAAGGLHVEPPETGAALREVGGNRPILQEVCAVMKDFSK